MMVFLLNYGGTWLVTPVSIVLNFRYAILLIKAFAPLLSKHQFIL